jgi:single-strand DNA-binding protein
MRTFQVVHLIGRLGADPELRYLPEGQALARLRVATDRPARAGAEPETDWHSVVCWERLAEFCVEYLTTGRLVFVTGRLAYRTFEGQDGQRRRVVEIVAADVMPLDRRLENAPARDEDESAHDEAAKTGGGEASREESRAEHDPRAGRTNRARRAGGAGDAGGAGRPAASDRSGG